MFRSQRDPGLRRAQAKKTYLKKNLHLLHTLHQGQGSNVFLIISITIEPSHNAKTALAAPLPAVSLSRSPASRANAALQYLLWVYCPDTKITPFPRAAQSSALNSALAAIYSPLRRKIKLVFYAHANYVSTKHAEFSKTYAKT
jgi:hypothetical protein